MEPWTEGKTGYYRRLIPIIEKCRSKANASLMWFSLHTTKLVQSVKDNRAESY